jgi:LPS sulfotransferase NodH
MLDGRESELKYNAADFRSALIEMGIERTYTIAFSLRSGSTMLCDMLTSRHLGKPSEFFHYPYDFNPLFDKRLGKTPLRQLLTLIGDHSAGGYFGSKVTHDHRARLEQIFRQEVYDYDGLASVLPNHSWIFLKRRRIVEQAISLFIAERSGRWHITANAASSSEPTYPAYDFLTILSKVMILSAHNVNWEYYFSEEGINALCIEYEDLARNPPGTFALIARNISGDRESASELAITTDLQRISNLAPTIYRDFQTRFLDDFLKIGQSDDLDRLGQPHERWNRFFNDRQWLHE